MLIGWVCRRWCWYACIMHRSFNYLWAWIGNKLPRIPAGTKFICINLVGHFWKIIIIKWIKVGHPQVKAWKRCNQVYLHDFRNSMHIYFIQKLFSVPHQISLVFFVKIVFIKYSRDTQKDNIHFVIKYVIPR